MYKYFCCSVFSLLSILCFVSLCASAAPVYWQVVASDPIKNTEWNKQYPMGIFVTYDLEIERLESELSRQTDQQTNITLPAPNGVYEDFIINLTPVMAPALQNRYSTIKTYSGYGITDPYATVKLDITQKGFHAMVLSHGMKSYFIDPVSDIANRYISYARRDFTQARYRQTIELMLNNTLAESDPEPVSDQTMAEFNEEKLQQLVLRRYRLALASSAEYTQFQGGKIGALAALATTINRVNGIYERDLGITLELIANNDKLLFSDINTDPYSVPNVDVMMIENQLTIDKIISSDQYDIGHVFYVSDQANGVANRASICQNKNKAFGVTGMNDPNNDSFISDFVAHEIGHQFGANHTMSGNCQANPPTAVEPGSGSTIMSYAGICAPNVQNHNSLYFHSISIAEIHDYINNKGDSCADKIIKKGKQIKLNMPVKSFIIPTNTPFFLTSEVNRENLIYTWEQNNPNNNVPMPPRSRFVDGPLFRSFPPSQSAIRFFPSLFDLTVNPNPLWQVLPSAAAELNFNLTVRDTGEWVGNLEQSSVHVQVSDAAGPFRLNPLKKSVWTKGRDYQVQWQVANTDKPPINCHEIDLLLVSTSNNLSTIPLLLRTPNTGSASVLIPDSIKQQAYHIMVRCSDNVFFSLSELGIEIR